MTRTFSYRVGVRLLRLFCLTLILFASSLSLRAQAVPDAPVLLSEATSTRAIAIDSLTFQRDPFPLTSPVAFSADRRTRVMLFAMNLNLLPGEGANAITAEAEDGNRRRYPLTVEYVGKVPNARHIGGELNLQWLHTVVVRLHDEMGDVGDVLVRIGLHGVSSNRVRIAIGHNGGGPADDRGAVATPAPSTPPEPTPEPTPNTYAGPQSERDTVRFLEQATWGPTPAEIARVKEIGFRAFLDEQFAATPSSYPQLPLVPGGATSDCQNNIPANCIRDNYSMYPLQVRFFQNALYGQDQLRQRVAFALSQILVVSGRDINLPGYMAPYLRLIDRHAFGNYRQLLYDMTLNPAMGRYLDMAGNTKANPNENYAREILQLFSIGLDQLNTDGTPKLDAQGNRIPTYDQATVNAFARVFTGWNLAPSPSPGVANYVDPMRITSNCTVVTAASCQHDAGQKVLLNGTVLPPGQTPDQDLNAAIDNIYNHPSVGPFIGKQLIQHLVTSNPSPAYVERVATVFNDNRSNPRQLQFVVEAILLDPEGRGDVKNDPNYGHLREPVQYMTNILRAFNAQSADRSKNSDGYLYPQSVPMDQDVFRAPSVFNYYTPDYQIPGTAILGPEFEILSTATAFRRINFVNTMVYSRINVSNPNAPNGTSIDLSGMQALAGNPAQLVNALDTLLMHGTMSEEMRNTILQAISTPNMDALARTRAAIYLILTSSQYQVER